MEGHTESKDNVGPFPVKESEFLHEGRSAPTIEEEKQERMLIWKIDLHILPFVVLLYLFSFLDRGLWPRDLNLLLLHNPTTNRF